MRREIEISARPQISFILVSYRLPVFQYNCKVIAIANYSVGYIATRNKTISFFNKVKRICAKYSRMTFCWTQALVGVVEKSAIFGTTGTLCWAVKNNAD